MYYHKNNQETIVHRQNKLVADFLVRLSRHIMFAVVDDNQYLTRTKEKNR